MKPEDPDYDALEEIARRNLAGLENTGRQAQPDDPLTVSINSPHTVSVHGNAVAINIKKEEGAKSIGGNADVRLEFDVCENGSPATFLIPATRV
jgi:hypothetical protein